MSTPARILSVTTISGPPDRLLASLPGTRAAAAIERHVLDPLARTGRAGAAIARHISNCASCKTDTARLDGDGTRGSAI